MLKYMFKRLFLVSSQFWNEPFFWEQVHQAQGWKNMISQKRDEDSWNLGRINVATNGCFAYWCWRRSNTNIMYFFERYTLDAIESSVILQIFQQHVLECLAHHHNLDQMQRQAYNSEDWFSQYLLYRQQDLCVSSSRAHARWSVVPKVLCVQVGEGAALSITHTCRQLNSLGPLSFQWLPVPGTREIPTTE